MARLADRTIYNVIEGGRYGQPTGRAFDVFIGLVVIAAVGIAVAETEPQMRRHAPALGVFQAVFVAIFGFEYLLRVAVCVYDRMGRYPHPVWGRVRYALTPMAIVDLLAWAPWVVVHLTPLDNEHILILRCLPLFKLMRYFAAFETLAHVVRNERRQLISAFLLMLILLVLMSAAAYVLEHRAQPEAFGSVLRAMWWGIVTLTTVGYGDMVPITPMGKLLGSLALILGLGMFALPAGIIANGFAEEMRRRNFVVTWHMVAQVPMFEHLPAARIAELASMLEARVASRGEAVIIKGERGDGMYFLVDGEMEVMLEPDPVRLFSGDYFGEIALLYDRPRSASVVARRLSQLLMLRADRFRRLVEQSPDLGRMIREKAEARLAGSTSHARG